MIEWIAVSGIEPHCRGAYLYETETILVRFPDGVEWAYSACPVAMWEEFTAPGQSRGEYIARVLDAKPNGRWTG
ncbi:MAG: hypothetical protein ACRDWD_11685 [Acidimicrobiia bacterium]